MENRDYSTGPGAASYGAMTFENKRRISWGAIIAGTVAALSVQLLLTFLGLSIGLWAFDPRGDAALFQGLGIGAAIWALLSFIVALYVGGWIAGRMSGLGSRFDGMLEGFMVWGTVTVVTFMLLTTAVGGIIGGAAGLAGEAMAMAGEQVDDPEQIVEEYAAPAREQADEAAEAAPEVADDVATAGAASFFWAFLALLLGAAAATFAGRQGSASGLREVTDTAPRTK